MISFFSAKNGRVDSEDRRSRHCPYLDTINRSVIERGYRKGLGDISQQWSTWAGLSEAQGLIPVSYSQKSVGFDMQNIVKIL